MQLQQALREIAMSYRGNWYSSTRCCSPSSGGMSATTGELVGDVPAMILLCVVTAAYAGRGIWRALRSLVGSSKDD